MFEAEDYDEEESSGDITGDESPEKDLAAEERRQEERLNQRAGAAIRRTAERKHQRETTAAVADDTQDDSSAYMSHVIDLADDRLDQLVNRKRSGKETLQYRCVPWGIDEHIVHIKLYSKDTSIKVTQWNGWCVRSTWLHRYVDDSWHKVGDREDIKLSLIHI